jgi:hypothetical protein
MKHVHLNKHFTSAKLFQLLALSSVIVLLGVAAALLLPGNPRLDSHASRVMRSDMSIVGPPSLPAATVDAIFARIGSPMQGTGKVIETASRQNNIDDAFALAVWYTETNDGLTGVGLSYHNPGGVRGSVGYPSGGGGYTIYPSYAAAASYWFQMMRSVYVARGMTTVYSLAHIYVGTSSSGLWAGKVIALMERYHGEAPPPTPSPMKTATPVPSPVKPHQQIINAIKQRSSTGQAQDSHAATQQSVGGAGQAQGPHTATTQPPVPTQGGLELVVTCFALLLALAIFLWARYAFAIDVGGMEDTIWHLRPEDTRKGMSLQRERMVETFPLRVSSEQPPPNYDAPAFAPVWHMGNLPRTDALYFPIAPAAYQVAEPQTDAMTRPATPLRVPQSIALPALPAPAQAASDSGQIAYGGRLRRTVLLPSRQTAPAGNTPLPVTGGERPAGLLSRYGKIPQEEGPFIGQ